MRVAEFLAYRVRIRLKKEIKHASHARTATESLVVACRTTDGVVGWGEGLPRAYVTGETIDQAWELLQAVPWSQLAGTVTQPAEGVERVDALPPLTNDARGCFGNSVRCAVELSYLDALCRSAGVPLSAITAAVPETFAIRQSIPAVFYSAAFTTMRPYKQRLLSLLVRWNGMRQAKVKVGVKQVDDAATLRRIRAWAGASLELRIDANEAWEPAEVPKKVEPLLPYRLGSLEQPVPHAAVDQLAPLRGQIGLPIMLDESLCCEHDARRAIELGLCELFNLRLSKCGGLVATLKLAALAHQAGLGYQLGCQVGETGILSAAGRHFATSVAGIRFLEGSYDRHLVRERLTVEDLTWGYRGRAPALAGPGLGVTIDEAALRRVTIAEARFPID
jgi:muconate cycloisomerase